MVSNMRRSEVNAAESVAYLNRALIRLQDIWEEIGIPEEQRLQRTNDVHKHIQGLLDLMISEEESLKKRILKSIESSMTELTDLCTELHLPLFAEEDGCTMLQKEKNTRTRLEALREHKKQRMEEFKSLFTKDRELCDILCTSPFSIDRDALPSVEQLQAYRAYLDELTKEKERRHDVFVSIRREIVACMSDLEKEPETSFETDVMCEDEEAFCLSDDNITALNVLLDQDLKPLVNELFYFQLKESKAEVEVRCSAYCTKIQELWDRLEIAPEERDALSEHMVHSKKRNIAALRAEVERLEILKKQSMQRFIEAIRAEIALLWERSFYSQEQQDAFLPYFSDDFTEELLELHEAEVKTLKKNYEEHRELYEGVMKWQDNWTLYLELDRKANDPARFNNRGGNLLKEEKQRTDLQKSLPKLEKTLMAQIDVWELEHGREFLVGGQKFLEYVQQQWDQHHTEKEREKMERQLKKTKQTQEDMLFGTAVRTPSKRGISGTPMHGKMRKLTSSSTPSTPASLLTSGLSTSKCQSSIQRVPLSAKKGAGLLNPGHAKPPRALDRNKENFSIFKRNQANASIATSYAEFASDLAKAVNMNSTVSHQ